MRAFVRELAVKINGKFFWAGKIKRKKKGKVVGIWFEEENDWPVNFAAHGIGYAC